MQYQEHNLSEKEQEKIAAFLLKNVDDSTNLNDEDSSRYFGIGLLVSYPVIRNALMEAVADPVQMLRLFADGHGQCFSKQQADRFVKTTELKSFFSKDSVALFQRTIMTENGDQIKERIATAFSNLLFGKNKNADLKSVLEFWYAIENENVFEIPRLLTLRKDFPEWNKRHVQTLLEYPKFPFDVVIAGLNHKNLSPSYPSIFDKLYEFFGSPEMIKKEKKGPNRGWNILDAMALSKKLAPGDMFSMACDYYRVFDENDKAGVNARLLMGFFGTLMLNHKCNDSLKMKMFAMTSFNKEFMAQYA